MKHISGFEKVSAAPNWAKLPSEKVQSSDDDSDVDDLLQKTGNYLVTSSSLPKGLIDLKQCTDANKEQPSEVDGKLNPKIQSVFLDGFPIHCAHFSSDGLEVIMGSRFKNFQYYDMMAGKIVNVPKIKVEGDVYIWDLDRRDCIHRFYDEGCTKGTSIALSPNGQYLACGHNSTQENWKGVIGLEIHAQINTKSKLFSASSTAFGAPTNTQVSIFDAALPGTLPVLNGECVRAGVKTAIALNSKINKVSKFDRKHYFYADLPQGYQITQQRQPLAVGGEVEYILIDQNNRYVTKTARITQLQLEQDSGRSLHDEEGRQSLIDLNRAGIGLMEIVTEPDFENGIDCSSFVREVQLMMRQLQVCLGSFREGALRVDANISVHKPSEPLGVRSEVKNLGSLKDLRNAVDYEIKRQKSVLKNGGTVINETRTFDSESGPISPDILAEIVDIKESGYSTVAYCSQMQLIIRSITLSVSNTLGNG
uniref:Putative glutamyl-tRNA(Gln) amidotransferase subunit B, mitochondrial n=1 Tax=Magallana gigas TaxID=29159 RepID=K1QNM8_MAGGI